MEVTALLMIVVLPLIGGAAVRRLLALATIAFATLLGGCVHDGVMAGFQLKPDDVIIERRPDAAYEKLFSLLR